MKKFSFSVLLLCFFSTSWAGGPWPQLKGKGYFKLSAWWLKYDQHYTDAGRIDPNITTGIFNTSFYGEYGLTDRLTTQLYFPFFSRNYMNNVISGTTGELITKGEAINSLGDTDIGIKYALTQPGSKIPIAASLILGLPLGKDVGGTEENLQTGDGEFNQLFQVHAGTGFTIGQSSAYASLLAGFNNRTNNFSDEWRYGIEGGVALFDQKLWTIFRLNGVESLKNGATAASITSTSIFANNTEYTSYAIELAYYLTTNLGISATYASAFRGEIIAAAPSYSFGIFYDMNR